MNFQYLVVICLTVAAVAAGKFGTDLAATAASDLASQRLMITESEKLRERVAEFTVLHRKELMEALPPVQKPTPPLLNGL